MYRIWIALGALFGSLPLAMLTAAACELVSALGRERRRSGSWTAALEAAIAGVRL
jgi:hypothetical protein